MSVDGLASVAYIYLLSYLTHKKIIYQEHLQRMQQMAAKFL